MDDLAREYEGTIEQGLWPHFRREFKEVCAGNEELIGGLADVLIENGVFVRAQPHSASIRITMAQLRFIACTAENVLADKRFRGTGVKTWGREVAMRVRATQLLSGSDEFKVAFVLSDLDRARLISTGRIELLPDRLCLPIRITIELDREKP